MTSETGGMLLVWCALHVVLAMTTHELGHALMARALGGRVDALGWGHPQAARQVRLLDVNWFAGRPWLGGMAMWSTPPPGGWTRGGWAVVVAAGPLMNAIIAAALWADGYALFALLHALHGVANLLPSVNGGLPSDGQQLWRLWRGLTPHAAAGERGHAWPLP